MAPESTESDDDFTYDRPSKSQIKREMHVLLDLGKALIELPNEKLRQLPLSDTLYEAIRQAQRTTSREALRRQTHYVGKLMRHADAEAIRVQLSIWQSGSHAETVALHRIEAQRDLLLRDDDALTELLNEHPSANAQQLRTLIREGRKEAQRNAARQPDQEPQRKHYRALFQALKLLNEDTDSNDP